MKRWDRRTLELLVLSGVVLPLATVAGVRWAALAWGLSIGAVFVILFGLPIVAVIMLIGRAAWDVGPLGRKPSSGPEYFRDRIPERYHEEFALETLNETVEEGRRPGPIRRFALVYFLMVPAITLLVMIV